MHSQFNSFLRRMQSRGSAGRGQRSTLPRLAVTFAGLLCLHDVLAQAGSRPATLFDSPSAFYNSLTGSGQSSPEEQEPLMPEGVWMLSTATDYLMWVELEQGRLNLLERLPEGGLILRKRIPVSIGKQGIGKHAEGDQKTPIGNYRITSHLADGSIDDFYGSGAYSLSYPNALDQRHERTGHGIWLHGLPKDVTERPFLDSDGCVVIDNASLQELEAVIATGVTQVVISQQAIKWVAATSQELKRAELAAVLHNWEAAWEQRDNDAYLSFYADDFSDLIRNKSSWSEYKRRVNASKRYIDVELSDMSMLVDPVEHDLVTVRFRQAYSSNNHSWKGWKEQIWRNRGERWEIIYEGNG